ncbi:MAG: FlgD immunoglobulin-like domain containing protein, partial [Spirochaetaceae bacterium]|nr:FlgD immunoglobulin-like domain containing protein [Spirochaetaceae bacterium]
SQQRPVLEAGFVALTDFGSQGAGGAGSVAFTLPVPYAVWGGALRLVSTPSSMTSLPLGTLVELRGTIAKELSKKWLVGAAVDLSLGGNGSFGWGLSLDLGAMKVVGDLGPFKDFRWGAAFTGLGKGYAIPATGILGNSASSFPPPFTLGGGFRGTFLKTDELEASLGLGLSAPSFQDLELSLTGNLTWRGMLSLRAGWDFGLRETIAGNARSLIPSFGLAALFPVSLGSDDPYLSKRGWNASELASAISAAPTYGGVWAIGAGATLALGKEDTEAPSIFIPFSTGPLGAVYISPNNDGAKDGIELPVAISDSGDVVSWSFTVTDSSGQIVRRVLVEAPEPAAVGAQGAWESLTHVKQGVPLPEKVSWNGMSDAGLLAPDGEYAATVEAVDGNGNARASGPYAIIVDRTPPSATIAASEDPPVFSPDGDGSKDEIVFAVSGSVEDLWKAQILDASGRIVRSAEYKKSAPAPFAWDGKGADGSVVPDGIYAFVLSAADRAGNPFAKRIDNIVSNTQQPPVNLVIDLAAFSPNGDGVKDAVSLFPSVPVRSGIVRWTISVTDRQGRAVWTVAGTDSSTLKDRVAFDGRDEQARPLTEGEYRAILSIGYLNGHEPRAISPYFVLDVTAPDGSASADRQAFNPAGGAGQDAVRFTQSARKEARWTAEVIGPTGAAARTWNFSPLPDPVIDWDGTDDAGMAVPDGAYSYRLKAVDGAGNSFVSDPVVVSVDTAAKAIRLHVDQKAFSPLPSSPKNRVTFSQQVQGNDRIRSYEMSIIPLDAAGGSAGSAVRIWRDNKGVPETIVWDGVSSSGGRAPEGRYAARLAVSYLNGDSADATSSAFVLDTIAPQATIAASPLLFSPSEASSVRSVTFSQKSIPGDDWEAKLIGPDGKAVRSWTWKGQIGNFGWNGTDEAGNLAPDG